jgi:DNA-binding GntR family transcriptional regulator
MLYINGVYTLSKVPTLSQESYRLLRSMILSAELKQGQRLIVRVLAETLGLSPTPIKEALVALEKEGFVVAVPRRGYTVASLEEADIHNLYAIREVLEGLAARLAAERQPPLLLKTLTEIHHTQLSQLSNGRLEPSGDSDLAFHKTLWEATGNPYLNQTLETFAGKIRLLILSTRSAIPRRHTEAVEEHAAVLASIKSGQPDVAERAMRLHIQNSSLALYRHIGEK